MKYLLLLLLTLATVAHAEADTQLVHDVAHCGAGYMVNTMAYGLGKAAFRMEPYDARIFAAGTGVLVGLSYNGLSSLTTHTPFNTRGVVFTGIGIGLSALTTWAFEF